jgi:hypothetical protein
MSHSRFREHLHAYISVRKALGFQMRAERTLLQDVVHFVDTCGQGGPSGPSGLSTGPARRRPSGGQAEPPTA